MHSHRFEPRHSRLYSDRSSRQWDSYHDGWERRDPQREHEWAVEHKYGGETERTSRREYSHSPKRPYKKDSFDRDRSRRSPVRRRMSSPGRGSSEKKRQKFEGDGAIDETDYRFRHGPEGRTRRWSPDSSHAHETKDLERTALQEEDFKSRKTSQDSRHRYRHEDVTYRHHCDEIPSRPSSGFYKDRDGHESGHRLPERTPSQEYSSKYYENDVSQKRAADPEQRKSTKGFQRFLELLNKGVDVAMLNKIVSQTSSNDRPHSPTSSTDAQRRGDDERHNTSHWNESGGSQMPLSPQSGRRSFSPKKHSLSIEKSLQRSDKELSHSRSRSPQREDKVTLTPEDEHKHKQMQDVLQAIGLNLGFEELGQMSHRIQERLYGKKESDGRSCERSGEKDSGRRRRARSPRLQSRSSSSRSSLSPSPQEGRMKEESLSSQRDGLEDQQQDQQQQNATYTWKEHFAPPLLPTYPAANYSVLPYPPLLSNVPQNPAIPLPHGPPFLSYPPVQPFNMFPSAVAHTNHLPPQHTVNPQPFFNPPVQPLNNNQKAKTLSRPRCLQVIETKQAG